MIKLDTNKIMKGSPPPREYQVTLENWRKYPYNIWAFVNVRSIIPTSPIMFDPKQRIDVIKKLVDLNDIEISHNNTEKKLKDILVDCNTDSLLAVSYTHLTLPTSVIV